MLAQQEFDRAAPWCRRAFRPRRVLDQRQQQFDGANAALTRPPRGSIEAEHALDAATHDVELYTVNIADNTLVAPHDGRIQYRIANLGEVLPAGGKVFTMLDTSYVYMDIYLPTAEAGRSSSAPMRGSCSMPIRTSRSRPRSSFIATQAQFTPKTVETQTERDKLMFRIRVRIDPDRLRARAEARAQRLARRRLCAHRSGRRRGRRRCRGPPRNDRALPRRVARLDNVTHRYGTPVALDDVTLALPAGCMVGLIGPDGVGKSTLLAILAGARQIQSGSVIVLGGDMADARAPRRGLPAHRLHAAGARQESLSRPQRAREHRILRPPVRADARRAGWRIAELLRQHRPGALRRSAGEETFRRHAAEARAVLRADPRSRSPDPRRADHRRRSAVAPPVLGPDRAHARAPAGHERARRHRLYGRGRALRLAGRDGRRASARDRHAGGAQGADAARRPSRTRSSRCCRPSAAPGTGRCKSRRAASLDARAGDRGARSHAAASATSPPSTT